MLLFVALHASVDDFGERTGEKHMVTPNSKTTRS